MSSELLPKNIMLRARGVGKIYRIGDGWRPGRSIKDDVARLLWPGRYSGGAVAQSFTALENVSFDLSSGEILGILGSNGAGKSTLLKVLCRITPPTTGDLTYRGRVAAVLEVGTGFHPDLSGRENIYLNGAILGMRRREIDARFDAIVAFSEIGGFLDEPVKRYSSGMHVRLAFAIAAHLEPDILVIDEVLAVGDERFRAKCLDHVRERFAHKAVIFVSHDMEAVRSVCTRCLLLDAGRVAFDGPVDPAISAYRTQMDEGP